MTGKIRTALKMSGVVTLVALAENHSPPSCQLHVCYRQPYFSKKERIGTHRLTQNSVRDGG
jgi:hypothetical protein